MDSQEKEKELDMEINLCDTCKFEQPECPGISLGPPDNVVFGNGHGNDNIIDCGGYEPVMAISRKVEIIIEIQNQIKVQHEKTNLCLTEWNKDRPGMLIIFEGPDGAGKTTIAKMVTETLNSSGLVASYVRTPGGTDLSEQLRKILLYGKSKIGNRAEAYLFLAQMAQCIEEVIKPKLDNNELVVCDRLIFSSFAYQGAGRGMDLEWLYDEMIQCLQGVWPDIGFMMYNPFTCDLDKNDRIESAEAEFLWRVHNYYHLIMDNKQVSSWVNPIEVQKKVSDTQERVFDCLVLRLKEFTDLARHPELASKEESKDV